MTDRKIPSRVSMRPGGQFLNRRLVPVGVRSLLVCLALFYGAWVQAEEPQFAATERGAYQFRLQPLEGIAEQAPLGELHTWVLSLRDAQGNPFIPGQLHISGGMPSHGHGLPSEPRATRYLDDGRFQIDGVLFNMGGEWRLTATFTGPAGLDTAVLAFELQPKNMTPAAGADGSVSDSAGAISNATHQDSGAVFSAAEKSLIHSLSLAALPPMQPQAGNALTGNPAAIELGTLLFNDPGLSATGTVSCATCHKPHRAFADSQAKSKGTGLTQRNAPGLLGVGYRSWLYWDGRRDSLWAQALTPLETVGEMDNNRTDVVRYVAQNLRYQPLLAALEIDLGPFADKQQYPPGAGPFAKGAGRLAWQKLAPAYQQALNQAFASIGKAIAAYERTLVPTNTRFDRFAQALTAASPMSAGAQLSAAEVRGLRLFIDTAKTRCLQCHNGPLLTNEGFHNIGTGPALDGGFDYGRAFGLQAALFNPFHCRGPFSDDQQCQHVQFAQQSELPGSMNGAFKVPGLRHLAQTGPYQHDGRHADLLSVLRWYNEPPAAADTGHELTALNLPEESLLDLQAFLLTLSQE